MITTRSNNATCRWLGLLLLLVMMVGIQRVWADDFTGIWYIANEANHANANTSTHWYIVPAKDPQQTHYADAYFNSQYSSTSGKGDYTGDNYGDPEKPFITTYKTNRDKYSIWQVKAVEGESGYYYLIHGVTGKYLVYEPPYKDATNRKSIHLEETASPGDNAKFAITGNLAGAINIRPKSVTTGNRFLNPASDNKDYYHAEGGDYHHVGMVGLYNGNTDKSQWYFEEVTTYPTDNTYTYHIVDKAGDIAIKKTVTGQEAYKDFTGYADIPEDIRSPYLSDETITFYTFAGEFDKEQLTDDNEITHTPLLDNANIYVTYTTDHLSEKRVPMTEDRAFNVSVNGTYIYDNSGTLGYETTTDNLHERNREWYFTGEDPYAMHLKNASLNQVISYTTSPADVSMVAEADAVSTRFILMTGVTSSDEDPYAEFEMMAATGGDTYYRLALPDGSLTLSAETSATNDALQVRAYAIIEEINYYLIDRQGKLLAGPIDYTSSTLSLPDEWLSPLVSKYHFYTTSGYDAEKDTYSPTGEVAHLIDVSDHSQVYVTYDVSTSIDLDGRNSLGVADKTSKTYMLKFRNGEDFYQEDGSDGVMTTKRKAIYPYSNGDAALYVYGQERWNLQLESGASTRSRWLWVIEPANSPASKDELDPYHVYISSNQTQTSYKDAADNTTNYHSYLRTYQPKGYTQIVTSVTNDNPLTTGGSTGDPANKSLATEYMITGTSNHFHLRTRNEVALDLNSDGDTDDDGESSERRNVDNFEMYWKNNSTAWNILNEAGESVGEQDVTYELSAAQQAVLTAKGWHTYQEWANAAPWSSNSSASKTYSKGRHWYQTIEMGDDFQFEEVSLTPVLILLDQHGWEIVRINLPSGPTDPKRAERYAALRKYSSPMVSKYHYWKTASKVPGYHKYTVSNYATQVGSDEEYTSEELGVLIDGVGNLPDYESQGLVGGKERDWYVTYDVKATYANSYTAAATEEGTTASAFVLKQGGQYAITTNGINITSASLANTSDAPTNMQWILKPNFNIDREMGYRYAGEDDAESEALSKEETDQENYDAGYNGFDPYNMQVMSKAFAHYYFMANTTGSALDEGAWTGTSSGITLHHGIAVQQTATGHDHCTMHITNSTFMVVDDGNGNMRLMPRFDHTTVMTSFATLSEQADAAPANDEGTASQSLWIVSMPREIHSSDEIDALSGHYTLAEDFSFADDFTSLGTESDPFTGFIDGQLYTLGAMSQPLVAYADGATIKNIVFEEVTIDETGNSGAIVANATGDTHVYNCGVLAGTVKGTAYTGGIVGLLDGNSRVINCYSYADITGGTKVGGIVGYNSYASTSSNLKTMVMNCMFYGDITGCENISPVYNGERISNKYESSTNTGLNNFNYFYFDRDYVSNITEYNCAQGAEERFLNRFEFFRQILNSTRDMASWYVSGTVNKELMAKWVLDKTIAPYPILKPFSRYPSVMNPDAENATTQEERNKGGLLGTLSVTINMGSGGAQFAPPAGAEISNSSLTLNITDKDPDNFNFNYKKVQLPYYNDVGTGNYTGNRVVTGWKIVSITGGTPGTFTAEGTDAPAFNFVDRACTNKDLYGVGGSYRVFNQGAYWEVPDDVTAITIEPYWAQCVYLSDTYYDHTYEEANKYNVTVAGTRPTTIGSGTGEQKVYNDFTTDLLTKDLKSNTAHTVYDYAVVLVGNYHKYFSGSPANIANPFTLMSADFDGDNEPDYCFFYYHSGRVNMAPFRFDFICIPGIGTAKRTYDSTMNPQPGIFRPKGWAEITNTTTIRFGQFEYGADIDNKVTAPCILEGGVYEQFVSGYDKPSTTTSYLRVGGNAWFKEFNNGCHTNNDQKTKKIPINVAGGDFNKFYLTGIYRPNADNDEGNAVCYIDGGRFGEVAGAGMQQVKGDVKWFVNAADIDDFYGGGINDAKPITGNVSTSITNSYVTNFYGGPKFGSMAADKTVTTTATGCTFGRFFGAGYGGTAYNRVNPGLDEAGTQYTNNYNWGSKVTTYYKRAYDANNGGISTSYDYEFLLHSNGTNTVERFYVNYASLSLATTKDVTSTLNSCKIGTFFGGGNLGSVEGDITSTLTDCEVTYDAYGGGYSAAVPDVMVMPRENFVVAPAYDVQAGVFNDAQVVFPTSVQYYWSNDHGSTSNPFTDDEDGNHYIYTSVSLDNLGVVSGAATLTIDGSTTVAGSVFGGGDASKMSGNTTVNIKDEIVVNGSVYGGGNEADVAVNTTVNMTGGSVKGSVYGGGNVGSVGTYSVNATGKPTALSTENTGLCTVNVSGGSVGEDDMVMPTSKGHVFGAGKGVLPTVTDGMTAEEKEAEIAAVEAKAYADMTEVNISGTAFVKGSVYGGSESGHVLHDTHVTISGGQVGNGYDTEAGKGINRVYTEDEWTDGYLADVDEEGEHKVFAACAHWEYVDGNSHPYDMYADEDGYDAQGGATTGTDGHTFYGNVFGGGSGYVPYAPGQWLRSAGRVEGNTVVDITGGHVLTNVYGGCETADVEGSTTVNMTGGTVGVPRTDAQIDAHPHICYVYGAGKGDEREMFNTWTNVGSTSVNVSGGWVYCSVFGGGEDGHVVGDAVTTISGAETKIGTSGVSSKDGNVFGGGRGFSGTSLTAGVVGGNVSLNISGGEILGSVYGGGRNASVGTLFRTTPYGEMQDDVSTETHGHININMSGGKVYHNVFGGGMGLLAKPELGLVKTTNVKIIGGEVKLNVYGGANAAKVLGNTNVQIGE